MTPWRRHAYAGVTDAGRVRDHNEDAYLTHPPLFAVADGLGGHEAGEIASALAIQTLRDHAPAHADTKALARAIRTANREVQRAAREGIGGAGMGTTIVAAIVEGVTIALAHVGDSRAYLLHEGVLQQLTEDHSLVGDMVRTGQLSEAEARIHPNRAVITRALGTDSETAVDTMLVTASPGDRLLLCSDGLTGMVDSSLIETLLGDGSADEVAHRLVAEANANGGSDNITVVVVDIALGHIRHRSAEAAAAALRARERITRSAKVAPWAWALAFVLLVGGALAGVRAYAGRQVYVGVSAGRVAIYRGVPGQVAGIALSRVFEETTLSASDLPADLALRVTEGVTVDDVAAARELVASYRAALEPVAGSLPAAAPSTVTPAADATSAETGQ